MMERNKPEPAGYALGEQLDKFCEVEIDKYKASGLAVPRRCNTCAFRKGTFPNGCVTTVMDALKCTLEGDTQFLCHEHKKGEEPSICAGYLLLANNDKPIKTDWKFSDEYSEPTNPEQQ
jgi:hypothetical protein